MRWRRVLPVLGGVEILAGVVQARLIPLFPSAMNPAFSFPSSSPRFAASPHKPENGRVSAVRMARALRGAKCPRSGRRRTVCGRSSCRVRDTVHRSCGAGVVFVLCGDEDTGRRTAVCLSTKDGAVLWKHDAPGEAYRHHRFNSVASSTPAADAERVYFSWGSPEKLTVTAFHHDGRTIWEADLGPVKREHGYGCSPIVHDGLVILSNDQESDCALFALDAATGQVRWKLPRTENHSNFATPCIYQPAGGPAQIIVSSWRLGVTGVELATGRQLWQKAVFGQKQERAIASPIRRWRSGDRQLRLRWSRQARRRAPPRRDRRHDGRSVARGEKRAAHSIAHRRRRPRFSLERSGRRQLRETGHRRNRVD